MKQRLVQTISLISYKYFVMLQIVLSKSSQSNVNRHNTVSFNILTTKNNLERNTTVPYNIQSVQNTSKSNDIFQYNTQSVQNNLNSHRKVTIGSKDDLQRKFVNYEVEGWPKSKNRTTNLFLRYGKETALIKPTLKSEQSHF